MDSTYDRKDAPFMHATFKLVNLTGSGIFSLPDQTHLFPDAHAS
jgi:hypothetical protein